MLGVSDPRKYIDDRGTELAERFEKHLNGPMGQVVLDTIAEGDVYTIENAEHILKIKKENGKCHVDFVGYTHDKVRF